LIATGTPSNGAFSPAASRLSAAAASTLADSSHTILKAFTDSLVASIRSNVLSTSCAELISPAANDDASPLNVAKLVPSASAEEVIA
jgi:hypothetical protein